MRRGKSAERGFVLIAVTFAMLTVMGVTGLAVDLGRMYVGKSEAQSFCDAAAIAAAARLDGAAGGIDAAKAAVTATYNAPWNWGADKIGAPQVDFSTGLGSTWYSTPAAPAGYRFARVRTSMQVRLYLLPAVVNSQFGTVSATAAAAQIPVASVKQGLGPYTVVSTDDTSPTLGLVPGKEYTLQWPQYNGSKHGCGPQNPEKCFNSNPCADEPKTSMAAVVQYWGASTNGYWGSNQNSEIAGEVLDLIQVRPVAVGDMLTMSSGNKDAQSKVLDERVNQDKELLRNVSSEYFGSPVHNGRRLMGVPVAKPGPAGTRVTGFGLFLPKSNGGSSSNYYRLGTGNDPSCAVYVGPYVVGSTSPGASTGAGAFRVALVE